MIACVVHVPLVLDHLKGQAVVPELRDDTSVAVGDFTDRVFGGTPQYDRDLRRCDCVILLEPLSQARGRGSQRPEASGLHQDWQT